MSSSKIQRNSTKLRYKFDETYRLDCIRKSKERIAVYKNYEEFRELRKVLVNMYNTAERLETAQRNLKVYKQRLQRLERKKEELALAWGKKRANLKAIAKAVKQA